MITFKPIPREKNLPSHGKQKVDLRNFTVRAISNSKAKLDKEQVAWVADRVARMLGDNKGDLSGEDINKAIDYIRFLLSKMQVLKTKRLSALARELWSPGEGRRTRMSTFVRPRQTTRRRAALKKVA